MNMLSMLASSAPEAMAKYTAYLSPGPMITNIDFVGPQYTNATGINDRA